MNLNSKSEEIIRLVDWAHSQNVKLLTLNGSFGGKSGSEFDFLSSDLLAQDDWHIGKKYNSQSWLRFPVIIFRDIHSNKIEIRYAEEEEIQNAYLIVSKRKIRELNKDLLNAKSNIISEIACKLSIEFINSFNEISNGLKS